MNISRRIFFKGIAAATVTVMITKFGVSLASAIGDPRIKAWNILKESRRLFKDQGKSPAYFAKMNELLDHMVIHFKPAVSLSHKRAIQECNDYLKAKGKYKNNPLAHWRTCYNSTFAITIIRTGLKDYKLPMIQAKNWKSFAKHFIKIIVVA